MKLPPETPTPAMLQELLLIRNKRVIKAHAKMIAVTRELADAEKALGETIELIAITPEAHMDMAAVWVVAS